LRANDHVVFLFNGGYKTKGIDDAKICPNVGPYIKQANLIVKQINMMFQERIIEWNEDYTDIIL